ncbi:probable beta-D-xylosidase 2 isoform X3 [Haliotis rufescens]|uniref:probable beta-D-xylosidase 2 isoform X3 n=1 Tax=Haliotis rufescens TaxID=6454 RepID=UPI00201EAC76|nr:probable beta-D-xylosidase 2 isoform X3 [Haliotis rufescens]
MLLLLLVFVPLVVGDYPFRNTSLPWEDRVNDLVGRLTLDEIQLQMARGGSGPNAGPAPAIPRLGIKPYSWDTECLRGDAGAGDATAFPQAIGLGASFSTDLIFRVAQATGEEVRAKYNNFTAHGIYGTHKGISCFSPVINIVRDPRWGRNQETYGEDPHLSGVFAANFVKGLQGSDPRYIRANAGCKHFNVHGGPDNIPSSRFSFDAEVSERDWRTTFLPAFRTCVTAGTYSLMCSYNRINGVPACANKRLLTDILRTEWGFKGYIVSDEAAIENIITHHHYLNNSVDTVAACVKAGCNLELSGNSAQPVYMSLVDAVKQGKLTEDVVRTRVKELFNVRMRLGEFDPPEMNQYTKLNVSIVQGEAHRNLSVEAALKTFVLLKNQENVLPLKPSSYKNVAVVGPMANNSNALFGDYSPDINLRYTTNPLKGVQSIWSTVRYGAGCTDTKCTQYNSQEVQTAAKGSDLLFVCLGTGTEIESEGNDKANLDLPGQQLQLLQEAVTAGQVSGAKVILLLFNAGPLNITWAVESPKVHAIMELFLPAQATGEALRRVLLAEGPNSVPAARLPVTWPRYMDTVPDMTNYSMVGRTYRYATYPVLFPFGYGLSYTSFFYNILEYPTQVTAGDDLTGSVSLINRGSFDADEVIQVYISWSNATVTVPQLQLVSFNRMFAPRGAQTSWEFTISAESMAVWTEQNGWIVEPGVISIWVGGQQPNARPAVESNVIAGQFTVTGKKVLGRY